MPSCASTSTVGVLVTPVADGEVGPGGDVDDGVRDVLGREALRPLLAGEAEAAREEHDAGLGGVEAELGRAGAARLAAGRAVAQARPAHVHLAADADPGGRREQGERRDEQREGAADRVEAEQVGERRRAEHARADHVREAGRAAVLERALPEPWLEHLEGEETRQAVAAPEREADGELQREQRRDTGTRPVLGLAVMAAMTTSDDDRIDGFR